MYIADDNVGLAVRPVRALAGEALDELPESACQLIAK